MHETTEIQANNQDATATFTDSACAGDMVAIRAQIAAGFDINRLSKNGESVLEHVIRELLYQIKPYKYDIVRELLRLGADAHQLSEESVGALFHPAINMDTEILRILLDAGADPNAINKHSADETLYDFTEFDYRYEIWDFNLPDKALPEDKISEEAWLQYLDRLAEKYGKARPDHLLLLRQRGALRYGELFPDESATDSAG